jgi:hypothetical protein
MTDARRVPPTGGRRLIFLKKSPKLRLFGILIDIDRWECVVMMGQLDSGQDKLFYSFNLDNHVPRTHLLRGIDHFLDLGALRMRKLVSKLVSDTRQ